VRFTIIIPARDRPERLRDCLDAIAGLSYPRSEFETIVADDGSSPPLEQAVTAEPFHPPLAVRFLRQENSGPAKARNRAAAIASGEWLAFLDDDCSPRHDWLQHLDAATREYPDCLLGGTTINGCPSNVPAEANQRLIDFVVDWFQASDSPLRFFTSNNIAVPSRSFREIGGFNETFALAAGEDREFCARWLASGRPMRRVPDAVMDHFHPQTITTFVRMHYRYGRGAALLHDSRSSSPLAFSSRDFYRELLVSAYRGHRSAAAGLANVGLLALSQAAAGAGFFRERMRRERLPG
jgi:GT2 family glycosyltransferase